jgi:hypothetical protein
MTGRIPDGEENWFTISTSFFKGLCPPWMPVHGVIGMLKEIGAFLHY